MIEILFCLLVQDWQPMQAEDLRLVDRLKAIEERIDDTLKIGPALEVIRRELAESRKEREQILGVLERFDLTPLRDALNDFSQKSSQERDGILKAVLEGREGLVREIIASREDIAARIAPLGGLVEAVKENVSEMREVKSGLLSGLAEVRAEVIKARAELTEAKTKLAQAQAELAEVRGSIGQRFFWFALYLIGGCAVLLIGGTALVSFVYVRLAKMINALPFPKVV